MGVSWVCRWLWNKTSEMSAYTDSYIVIAHCIKEKNIRAAIKHVMRDCRRLMINLGNDSSFANAILSMNPSV